MKIVRPDTKSRTGKAIPMPLDRNMELFHATQRIGDTGEKAMRWFLNFAQRDLSILSDGDWHNLEYELTALRCLGIPDAKGVWSGLKGEGITSSFDYPDIEKQGKGLMRREEITSFQALTQQTIEKILKKQSLPFKFPSLQRILFFDPPRTLRSVLGNKLITDAQLLDAILPGMGWIERVSAENPTEVLSYLMLDLLKEHAGLVRKCPEFEHKGCHRLFLADRKNQDFCSVKCQGRAATRRYRVERGLISGRPRGRPRKASLTGTKRLKRVSVNAQKRRDAHGTKKR